MREEQAAYRCIVEELAKQICSGTLCQDAPLSSVSVIVPEKAYSAQRNQITEDNGSGRNQKGEGRFSCRECLRNPEQFAARYAALAKNFSH